MWALKTFARPAFAAATAAERFPDARLVSLHSGGHLQLGQAERVRAEIASFLGE